MTTVDFITTLFYEVDEQMRAIPKHPEARLWPSEVVTLGLLHALNRSSGFTLLFVRVWDVSPLRFAPALRNDARRADGAPAPPRLAPCGHASNHGPSNDAGPEALCRPPRRWRPSALAIAPRPWLLPSPSVPGVR